MAGTTDSQLLRYAHDTDPVSHTALKNLADDIADQLTLADTARASAVKRPIAWAAVSPSISLPVTTVTTVTFNSEVHDSHGMIDLGSQPTRVTVSASSGTGIYQVTGRAGPSNTSAWTVAEMTLTKNGGIWARRKWRNSGGGIDMSLTTKIWFGAVGDYTTMTLYHEGGGTESVFSIEFRVQKITGN